MSYLSYIIIYLIGYIISFIIMYYNKIPYSSFDASLKQMMSMYLLSFVWPVLLFYVITVTILKYISTGVLIVYVYVKDFILNIFKSNKNKKGGKK